VISGFFSRLTCDWSVSSQPITTTRQRHHRTSNSKILLSRYGACVATLLKNRAFRSSQTEHDVRVEPFFLHLGISFRLELHQSSHRLSSTGASECSPERQPVEFDRSGDLRPGDEALSTRGGVRTGPDECAAKLVDSSVNAPCNLHNDGRVDWDD
jgi:hypothetical protein